MKIRRALFASVPLLLATWLCLAQRQPVVQKNATIGGYTGEETISVLKTDSLVKYQGKYLFSSQFRKTLTNDTLRLIQST